jgi:simple sugar transport system substrate-binding protein
MIARRTWLVLLSALALILAACTSVDEGTDTTGATDEPAATEAPSGDDGTADTAVEDTTDDGGAVTQRDYRFVVVSHGQSSDPFWSVAANGANDAAADMGVTMEYQAPGTFDMAAMAQLIDTAVASQPDGLVVTIPDADALGGSIEAAVAAGVPVVSMNSGSDVFAELGVLVHVGQTEYEAGLIAGQRMAEAGVTTGLCINQEVGNAALDLRCEGFTDGLGGSVTVVPVELADPAAAQAAVAGALSANAGTDGVLTLGPTGAAPTLLALEESGQLGTISLATFDLSPDVLQAIIDGDMLFAIDQAQYLQGYLPIVLLTKYLDTGALPLGSVDRVILTGPQIVTAETAASVIDASAAGLR